MIARSPRRARPALCAAVWAVLSAPALPAPADAAPPTVHGLLDIVAAGHTEADDLNVQFRSVSPFDAYQLRLFVDGAVTGGLRVYTQLLFSEAIGARPVGAYVMADPWPERDVHIVAGLIPWLIGTYEPQSYSDRNPLIGAPLMYQFHTTLRWDQIPAGPDAILAKAGSGNEGVSYASGARAFSGMPIVYSDWWDFGVGILGSARPVEFSVGIVNGTPGYPYPTRDENSGKGAFGRIGLAPMPGSRFGVSGAYGPYLTDEPAGVLPAGRRAREYRQVLAMADAEWSAAHLTLRAEGYRNTWETPTAGDLRVAGFYAEGKYALPAGFFVAGRHEIMRFSDLADSAGASRTWDLDWDRTELGLGYRITRGTTAKVAYQSNRAIEPEAGQASKRYDLVAGQLSTRF